MKQAQEHAPLIIEYLQKWGNASSIALLDPACAHFSVSHIEGVIGYRFEVGCAIVFGDPVCAPEHQATLTLAFHEFCQKKAKTIIYVTVSEQFTNWTLQNNICTCAAEIGHEIIINPLSDPKAATDSNGKLLRKKYNAAQRQGISVHEYTGAQDSVLEKKLNEVKKTWLEKRRGLQIYLSTINLFAHRTNKRYFYAQQNDAIIGVLMMNRLDGALGWVMNVLMRIPEAPLATSEFLILSVLDILRAEQCPYFSVGPVPALELGKIEGIRPISQKIIRISHKIASKLFNIGGNRQLYWKKFSPKMASSFFIFSRPKIGIREVLGIMRAFNAST